ncbi:MAG: serine/threonine-protein kinase, partial [Planctomycetota bacterium]
MTLTPGTEIGGYRIESLISQGGMGAVYKAIQLSVDRLVAFKTLLHDGNPKAVERFKQEAKIVARISHPNVVQVLDLREEGGVLFIAMELVDGVDLSTRLKEAGPLDESTAIDYMRQSAEALAAAHSKGVIHRDVKPSNIMLTLGNVVKVMDFGIAKSVVEETQITRAGALLGTPDYMPPEQISGEAADARSDIYALGATFYHLAAGRPPFVGKVYTDVLVSHKTETALPLTE